jgi:hypothetical protein
MTSRTAPRDTSPRADVRGRVRGGVRDVALGRHQHLLGLLAAYEYALTYVATTFGVLGWMWWRGDPAYRRARDSLMLGTAVAIACFALWPVTPPRLLGAGGQPVPWTHPRAGSLYVDIVARYHPPGSWGSGTVSAGADQYAAMPSLHVAWAVWCVLVTARARGRRVPALAASLAAAHLTVTAYVVLATANHYLLDEVAGAGLAVLADAVTGTPSHSRRRVAAPDALFLQVEEPRNPQHVGGVAIVARPSGRSWPVIDDIRAHIARRLPELPRLCQRVVEPGPVRGFAWEPVDAIDLSWHVREVTLPAPGGRVALEEFVSRVAAVPLRRDQPLWRVWFVRDVGAREAAVVVLLHHALADGLGAVALLRAFLEVVPSPGRVGGERAGRPPSLPPARLPGGLARAAGTARGLLVLARPSGPASVPWAGRSGRRRRFATLRWPLPLVRELARRAGVRVSDVLLALAGQALAEMWAERGEAPGVGTAMRVAVPVTLRAPSTDGPGNVTGALRIRVPLHPSHSPGGFARSPPTTSGPGARAKCWQAGRPYAAWGCFPRRCAGPPPAARTGTGTSTRSCPTCPARASRWPLPALS